MKFLAKSELYAGNLAKGINTWTIGEVRYSAGVVLDWTKDGSEDKENADLMWSFPQEGQFWKTVSEEKGRLQGLISVEDFVRQEEAGLSTCVVAAGSGC